jgi:hypothetical protein
VSVSLHRFFAQSGRKIVQFAASEVEPGLWLIYANEPEPLKSSRVLTVAALVFFGVAGFGFKLGLWASPESHLLVLGALILGCVFAVLTLLSRAKNES